ncbi:hypothetical protein AC1031_017398 [Aphanomyces cochlioides]|nr:hypothetical protein AC1031_017398 [Aphanomyces cochlioides]
MMKLALLAVLLALTTAARAHRQLREHESSIDSVSRDRIGGGPGGEYGFALNPAEGGIKIFERYPDITDERRLHDLWYYAPHADSVHPDSFIFTPVLPAYVRPDRREIEHSIHDRRLHDLWYYAPHINKQEPKQSPERHLKMQAPAQDRDRVYPLAEAGHVSAESPSVSESDGALQTLSKDAPMRS